MIHIPKGEKGSQNDLANRALSDPDDVLSEIYDKPTVCLNVIHILEQYGGAEVALSFAKKIIKFNQHYV